MLFCVCSVFGSFFLLMIWWIISFTSCPFALVFSTFSTSGGVFIQVIQHFHCFALHVPAFFVLA